MLDTPTLPLGYVSGRFVRPSGRPETGEVWFIAQSDQHLIDGSGRGVGVTAGTQAAPLVDGEVRAAPILPGAYEVRYRFPDSVLPGHPIHVTDTHTADSPLDLAQARA